MVTLGHINYLNCIPVHGAILTGEVLFDGTIVHGTPADLNRMLASGDVDISPSSSVELLKGYAVVPGLSISSRHDVQSIMLFTREPLETLRSGLFLVTSHSATSTMLLKVILREFFGIDATFKTFDPRRAPEADDGDVAGILHIGDIALRLGREQRGESAADGDVTVPPSFCCVRDLAALWYDATGLPFTFALWQIARGRERREKLRRAMDALRESHRLFVADPARTARAFAAHFGMSPDDMLDYWEHLSFDLTEPNIESLGLFFRLCRRHRLISAEPAIRFASL